VGKPLSTFRLSSIKAFAARHPSKYPEFIVDPERIARAVMLARDANEILPPFTGGRDDTLRLRWDPE
jgi:hypothetical protein